MVELYIIFFFFISLLKPIIFKVCANNLDHRTAPIFISVFILFGILITLPWFGGLLIEGFEKIGAHYLILFLCMFKGILFWYGTYENQKLKKESLSSTYYVAPLSLAFIACINSFLGEVLEPKQWISIIGLCSVSCLFFFKGHLQDLDPSLKKTYFKLALIFTVLGVIDHYTVFHSNWYTLLFISNLTLLCVCLSKRNSLEVWKTALFNKMAVMGGATFLVFEFVKFYPMVSMIPVSVILLVQVATTPIVFVLSALIWGERSWQEQFVWGLCSVGFIVLLVI